jgi:hypothetical protein
VNIIEKQSVLYPSLGTTFNEFLYSFFSFFFFCIYKTKRHARVNLLRDISQIFAVKERERAKDFQFVFIGHYSIITAKNAFFKSSVKSLHIRTHVRHISKILSHKHFKSISIFALEAQLQSAREKSQQKVKKKRK